MFTLNAHKSIKVIATSKPKSKDKDTGKGSKAKNPRAERFVGAPDSQTFSKHKCLFDNNDKGLKDLLAVLKDNKYESKAKTAEDIKKAIKTNKPIELKQGGKSVGAIEPLGSQIMINLD